MSDSASYGDRPFTLIFVVTNGPTDRTSQGDAWTHAKTAYTFKFNRLTSFTFTVNSGEDGRGN